MLGIVASLAIAVYAELGYRRLEIANRADGDRAGDAIHVHETLALIVDAETGQRGYLLTGKDEYLAPYTQRGARRSTARSIACASCWCRTARPRSATRSAGSTASSARSWPSSRRRSRCTRRSGPQAAQALLDTGIGRRTMDEIRAEVDSMAATHRTQLDEAIDRWSDDIAFARLGMQLMTAFTVALLLVVWFLARRDAQQREARRRSAVEDKRRLESEVEERTAELSELSSYLQKRARGREVEARARHPRRAGRHPGQRQDGHRVGRGAHEEEATPRSPPSSSARCRRWTTACRSSAASSRSCGPTLLDNLGLPPALDWQVHEICDRAGLACTIDDARATTARIPPQVSIALYRILQEALTNIVKYAQAKNVNVDLGVTSDTVTLLIEDDGIGIPEDAQNNLLSHGIAGMRQRVRALHGEFAISRRPEGGTMIEVNVPIAEAPTTAEELDAGAPSADALMRRGLAAAAEQIDEQQDRDGHADSQARM